MEKAIQVIWNPSAGPAGPGSEVRHLLERGLHDRVAVIETQSAEHAFQSVQELAGKAELIVAAGGDGTVNLVINALMAGPDRPPLGLLPMGTGNNLCRTLGIPLEPAAAVRVLASQLVRMIDLVKVQYGEGPRFYANVASGGNSDRVIECLSDEDKERWGAWCYVRSALPVMAELTGYDTRLEFDDGSKEQHTLWNVMVANGQHAAGGLPVAPTAEIDNGLLDVILILDGTPLDLAALASEFFLSDYLEDERVIHRRARSLKIEAEPELRFLADGEILAGQPFEFTIQPRALQVVVGEGPNEH